MMDPVSSVTVIASYNGRGDDVKFSVSAFAFTGIQWTSNPPRPLHSVAVRQSTLMGTARDDLTQCLGGGYLHIQDLGRKQHISHVYEQSTVSLESSALTTRHAKEGQYSRVDRSSKGDARECCTDLGWR